MTVTETQSDPHEQLETVCDRERVAIIFNPAAGTNRGGGRRETLEQLARAAGLGCDLMETDAELGARPLVERAVEDGMQRVIVSGGDGSLTEAAHVLAGTPVALALVPGGTGNLVAINLGVPTECDAAMRLALSGSPMPTDVGRANGMAFLVAVGMGLDAHIMRDADRELKSRFGKLAYFIAGWRNLGRRHTLFTVTVDGHQVRRYGQMVLVTNLGRITGGLELVPDCDPADGIFEVAILRTRRLRDFALIVWRALLRQPRGQDLLELFHGRRILVEASSPQPVEVDGDPLEPTTRLEINVEPGSLLLVRPDPAEAPSPSAPLAEARVAPASQNGQRRGQLALRSLALSMLS